VLLPLLRTNVWNPHPMLAAIYGGLFYHHGAGTRSSRGDLRFRLETLGYLSHLQSSSATVEIEPQLFAALVADPDGLIGRLTGRVPPSHLTLDFSALGREDAIGLPTHER
jgi:hypothetical protein